MKVKTVANLLLLILFILLTFWSLSALEQQDTNLEVKINLRGQIKNLEYKELVISFSEEMIHLGEERDVSEFVEIVPFIDGKFQWRGTNTLVFLPKDRFKYSTQYRIEVNKNIKSKNGKSPIEHLVRVFVTPFPTVVRYSIGKESYNWQYASNNDDLYEKIMPGDEIYLKFNQSISKESLPKSVFLEDLNGKQIPNSPKQISEKILRFKTDNLERGKQYKIFFKQGFRGTEGECESPEDFCVEFSTIPLFSLENPGEKKIFLEDKLIRFYFTNKLKEIKKESVQIFYKNNVVLSDQYNVYLKIPGYSKFIDIDVGKLKLSGGDRLKIKLSREITNIFDENLGKDHFSNIRIGSSQYPGISIYEKNGKFKLKTKSVKTFDYRRIDFKNFMSPEFVDMVFKKNFGLLKNREFISNHVSIIENLKYSNQKDTKSIEDVFSDKKRDKRGIFGIYPELVNLHEGSIQSKMETENYIYDLKFLNKSKIDLFYRGNGNDNTLWVYDRGVNAPGANFIVFKQEPVSRIREELGVADGNGILHVKKEIKDGDILIAINQDESDFAFLKISELNLLDKFEHETKISVFTDKKRYNPGETVHIAGILNIKEDSAEKNFNDSDHYYLHISGPGRFRKKIQYTPDKYGGFYEKFEISAGIQKGAYEISSPYDDCGCDSGKFKVEYFDKNTFEVALLKKEKFYSTGDKIDLSIKANYLSGSPLNEGTFKYRFYMRQYLDSFHYFVPENYKKYSFNFDGKYTFDFMRSGEGVFGTDGLGRISEIMQPRGLKGGAGIVELEVTGVSSEGKEYTVRDELYLFAGEKFIGVDYPSHFDVNKETDLKLVCLNKEGNLTDAFFDVEIYKEHFIPFGWVEDMFGMTKIKEIKNQYLKNEKVFPVTFDREGYYTILFHTKDISGRIITTYISIYVNENLNKNKEHFLFFFLKGGKVNVGDIANLVFKTNGTGTAMVSIGRGDEVDTHITKFSDNSEFEFKIEKKHFPEFKVEVIGEFDHGEIKEISRSFEIDDPDRRIDVKFINLKREIEPNQNQSLKFRTTDRFGKGVNSNVFVYSVDEGVLSLSKYELPDLYKNFFKKERYDNNDYFYNDSEENYYRTINSRNFSILSFSLPEFPCQLTSPSFIGRVVSEEGKPLGGVSILLMDSDRNVIKSFTTSSDGHYYFPDKRLRNYFIRFKKAGFINELVYAYRYMSDINENEIINAVLRKGKGERKNYRNHEGIMYIEVNVKSDQSEIHGTCALPDGSEIPGVAVTAKSWDQGIKVTVTNEQGQFAFKNLKKGFYYLKCELEGFYLGDFNVTESKTGINNVTATMETTKLKEMIEVKGSSSAPKREKNYFQRTFYDLNLIIKQLGSIKTRGEGKSLLFFKKVETDKNGYGEIRFSTSDRASAYRLIAVAYNNDSYGVKSERIVVNKKLLLEEAMPEFAQQGDKFKGGVIVSNLGKKKEKVSVLVRPENIKVGGKTRKTVQIDSNSNTLINFDFHSDRSGQAEIKFYGLSGSGKDGIRKEMDIFDNLISESIQDLTSGQKFTKRIIPQNRSDKQILEMEITPSLINPMSIVFDKTVNYPYECLEQKITRIMPYIVMSPKNQKKMGVSIKGTLIREMTGQIVAVLPEFQNNDGGMSYYRGGYSSDFMSLYTFHFLRLVKNKKIFDPNIDYRLIKYLDWGRSTKLPDNYQCYYQYILSIDKRSNQKVLSKLFSKRESLSGLGKSYLLEAIQNQTGDEHMIKELIREFDNGIVVESDFAYFNISGLRVQDMPFLSKRYVTAALLKAVLAVQGEYRYADRIVNWLMEIGPYGLNVTQRNLKLLEAIDLYMKIYEKQTATRVGIEIYGKSEKGKFSDKKKVFRTKREISDPTKPLDIHINADGKVYVTSELKYHTDGKEMVNRGIGICRNIYNENGEVVTELVQGEMYQVELLVESSKDVPYGVIDEPIPAGVEIHREDMATSRKIEEFNKSNRDEYRGLWCRPEYEKNKVIYYTYGLYGKNRINYYIKAMYSGQFSWLPTKASGMYHPQYFGREGLKIIKIKPSKGRNQ